jgi:cobalamin biosynthesis protein CobT
VVIDCSGSMAGPSIEKARLFGTLLAEAVRGHPGIDLRLFGFTDRVIYDAGTARQCAVHALEANGGNNDAAGLWHAYLAARASRRQAKLLVMISDGAPTECTVAALAGLVKRLTRRRVCCAQVAVQPLQQICFPHYVLLQDNRLDACVRQFGAVIMRLVGQTMGK